MLKTCGAQLTALRKANISSCPDSIETIPDGAPTEPTLPLAKTSVRSLPPSVSVSNWKLEAIKVTCSYNHEDIFVIMLNMKSTEHSSMVVGGRE